MPTILRNLDQYQWDHVLVYLPATWAFVHVSKEVTIPQDGLLKIRPQEDKNTSSNTIFCQLHTANIM